MAAPWFVKKGACYTGVDIFEEQLKLNKVKFPGCKFVHMHWRDIDKFGPIYDLVTSFFVLEHIVYPRQFLKACCSCVKPGGFFSVLCPNFLEVGYLPSQHFFGRKAGGIKAKIRKLQWIEAVIELVDRFVFYPKLIRKAQSSACADGAWLINLRPLCLEVNRWGRDWDAVYMVGESEVANYVEHLGFDIIERGAIFRRSSNGAMYPNFCYVLGQKS